MCSTYNEDLDLGDLVAITETLLEDEGTFTFLAGDLGVVTEFIPSRDDWEFPSCPPLAIVRMVAYDNYRTTVPTVLLTKLRVREANSELISYLQTMT